MAEHKGQNYLHGAAILTLGVIIMKVLGFFYKIPLGNILGDEGYSMFMGAYSIYNIFFTLATAGLPVALSRLVAEADAHGRAKQEEKTFRVALLSFTVLGLIFGAILLFFPNWLAAVYLENPDAGPSVRAMAPAILLVCMVSAYRGYCQGNGNMLPTTVDEVLEVFFKVVSGLVIAILVMRRFHGDPRALPLGSAGAIFGVSIGSTISLLYMVFYKRRNYDRLAAPYTGGRSLDDVPDDDVLVDPALKIVKDIFRIGVPIAFGACILAILNSVDSKLCMNRLQSAAGFSYREAKVLYGVYGKAQTLFNLPAAFITPLTISIVPAISGAIARKDRRSAAKVSEDSMRISAVIAVPMGVGLAVLAEPIMHVLYPGSHLSGPRLLAVMGIASFFVCLVLMENAILQASGKEKLTMMTLILGGLVKIAVNWFLVAQRSINIHGAPIGTLASYGAGLWLPLPDPELSAQAEYHPAQAGRRLGPHGRGGLGQLWRAGLSAADPRAAAHPRLHVPGDRAGRGRLPDPDDHDAHDHEGGHGPDPGRRQDRGAPADAVSEKPRKSKENAKKYLI